MAIDRETAEQGLAGLSVAAAELIEASHDVLVTALPDDELERAERFAALRRLGLDLVALAEAAGVLVRRQQHP